MNRRQFLKYMGMGALTALMPLSIASMPAHAVTPHPITPHVIMKARQVGASTLTRDNILDFIVECAKVLDEQDIPAADRWVYVPMSGLKHFRGTI